MKRIPVAAWLFALALTGAHGASPYAGQESRDIKALSPDEVDSLLAGKGMGLAKAAELNGYPGPLHVLELAKELSLTASQRDETRSLYDSMQAKAKSLGRDLVDEERKLDRLFAEKRVTPQGLAAALTRIGELQAQVRESHLQAHIAQARILTPEQNARYGKLRGYDATGAEAGDRPHQHKH